MSASSTTAGAEPEPLRTGWEDGTSSDDTLTLAGLRAMADRTAAWAEAAGGRVARRPGLALADSGSPCPFLNTAVAFGPIELDAGRAVEAFFPDRRPFVLISAVPTPDLRPAGVTLMGHPPFLFRPAGGDEPAPPPGITVREVVDAAGLAVWDRVLAEGFPMPESPAPPALLGSRTRFWLASRHGEPVATALSHVAHGVVNVEAVATMAAHRGHGAGAAVSWAATLAEPDRPAVLLGSDDGVGIYRRMGYLAMARWTLWFRG